MEKSAVLENKEEVIKPTSTVCEMKVYSVKKTRNYDKKFPIRAEIEFELSYEPKNIFFQMSGSSRPILNTVHPGVIEMFNLGAKVRMTIDLLEE